MSIESKIVEAVEGFDSFVGINWGVASPQNVLSQSGGYQGAPIDLGFSLNSATLQSGFTSATPFGAAVNVGTLDVFGNLTAALSLAEKERCWRKVIFGTRGRSAMNAKVLDRTAKHRTWRCSEYRDAYRNIRSHCHQIGPTHPYGA